MEQRLKLVKAEATEFCPRTVLEVDDSSRPFIIPAPRSTWRGLQTIVGDIRVSQIAAAIGTHCEPLRKSRRHNSVNARSTVSVYAGRPYTTHARSPAHTVAAFIKSRRATQLATLRQPGFI